jgi:hypothetical protein
MSVELATTSNTGGIDWTPTATKVAELASFKEGALSDVEKYPTDKLGVVAGKLVGTVERLTGIFLNHATDEQLVRMGPALASLLKELERRVSGPLPTGGSMMGGAKSFSAESIWKRALGKSQSGGVVDPPAPPAAAAAPAPEALVPVEALAPAAPAAPAAAAPMGALVPVAAAPAAPAGVLALAPATVVEQAQAALLGAQAGLVNAHVRQMQASVELDERRTRLALQIFDQAQPMSYAARQVNAVTYAVVVEGALVGLLYIGGRGLGGLGMIVALVVIQVYSAVSHLQVSKVLSGLGSALGAGVLSIGTGLGGAVANTITEMIGMGSLTDTIALPDIGSATGAPEGANVLVPGRGFTPGVPMPALPADYAEMRALSNIQDLVGRIDFFITRLFQLIFGETTTREMNPIYFCIASVVFIMLYHFIGHLIDIVDEVRLRRKVEIVNSLTSTGKFPPSGPSGGPGSILGLMSGSNAAGRGAGRARGAKKRRTLRKGKRQSTRQRATKEVVTFAY